MARLLPSFRRLQFAIIGRYQDLGARSAEQAAAGGSGGSEARLQAVAQRHQSINLGDNAVLLGERWETKEQLEQERLN